MSFFSSLIGNDLLKSNLQNDILSKNSIHAYIIEGDINSGRHTLAYEIAKGLTCRERGENLPCNKCENCNKINQKISTDITYFDAYEVQKEQVNTFRNDIIGTLRYLPNDSDFKFYIIENSEYLNENTQNLLLKSIEEPPAHVIWFFITTNARKLLQTVRSRCRLLRMQQFTTAEIINLLKNNYPDKTEDEIFIAAINSYGCIGNAESIVNKGLDETETLNSFNFIKLLLTGSKFDVAQYLNQFDGNKQTLIKLISSSILYLRDIISNKNNGIILYYSSESDVSALSKKTSIKKLLNTYQILIKSLNDLDKNINSNLIISNISSIAK